MHNEIKISELKIGMYVVEITEQKSNFRLSNASWIRNQSALEQLQKSGVTKVLVDPAKRKYPKSTNPLKSAQSKSAFEHLEKTQEILNESKEVQRKVFENIQNGLQIDIDEVKKTTRNYINTLFENPNAIGCLQNIRDKDHYLLEHSIGVATLTAMFARYLKLDEEVIQHMAIGAILHDIGKVDIPDRILYKPSRLTTAEFDVMKSHVTESIKRLRQTSGVSKLSLNTAALHHEKLNGSGYPMGLEESDIPINGRIIAICDVFDALTATRCYKQSFTHTKAFEIIRRMAAEGELDEILVKRFIDCVGSYPAGSVVELSSDKLAIVDNRNIQDTTKPRVYSFYDLTTRQYCDVSYIDLETIENVQIVKCIKAEQYGLNMGDSVDYISKNRSKSV
ncbi:HD-GYP domain-containing protein [Vibrio sp. F74]|uniref:HD-GYP domain-containing protein n=1 Tax=Vibrio sp. F74 TaxID=700020 RepID=UPI0035F5E5A3